MKLQNQPHLVTILKSPSLVYLQDPMETWDQIVRAKRGEYEEKGRESMGGQRGMGSERRKKVVGSR